MAYIYTPSGRAREYSALALNVYSGCPHRCKYCYVPQALGIPPERFRTDNPRPRVSLPALRQEVASLRGTAEPVLLSFACDPYPAIEHELCVTRNVLRVFRDFRVPFQVLTKAGDLPRRDFGLYFEGCRFAVTLTLLDEDMRKEWEPGAAPTEVRIENLREAKRAGISTWVSLEPVIDPEQTLELIKITAPFVDEFRIGKLNHLSSDIDWRAFLLRALALVERLGKRYLVKRDLLAYL